MSTDLPAVKMEPIGVIPREFKCSETIMCRINNIREVCGSVELCCEDIVLKMEKTCPCKYLCQHLYVDMENRTNRQVNIVILITTRTSTGDEKLSVLCIKQDPKTRSKFHTVAIWDWSETFVNIDVMFSKLQCKEYYLIRYPTVRDAIFRVTQPPEDIKPEKCVF